MSADPVVEPAEALALALRKWRDTEYGDPNEVVVDAELRDAIDDLPPDWLTRSKADPMSADPVVEPAEKMLAEALHDTPWEGDARVYALGDITYAHGSPTDTSWMGVAGAILAASPELKACIDLGRRIRDENDPLLSQALNAGRYEPAFNVCRNCKHLGGEHDLGNKCLICGDYFASMSVAEQWTYGQNLFRAALLRATEKPNA